MDDEQVRKIIDSPEEYDELREESYLSWAKSGFEHTQRWAVILVFVHFFSFFAAAIVFAILFFVVETTQYQIMYATLFVCSALIGYLIKVFGWIMVARNSLKKDIRKLELRIAELAETVKGDN